MERSLVAGLDGCREDSHLLSLAPGHALHDLPQESWGRPRGTLALRHRRQADDHSHERETDTQRVTHPVFSSCNGSNLAQVRAMRCRAADGVAYGGADEQVEVGARRPEWVVAGRAKLGAALPPAVLAHRHARVEIRVEPGAGAHAALRRLD